MKLMDRFLLELVKRWGAKQPWFFKVISIIAMVVAFITGVPGLLAHVCETMEICVIQYLPAAWTVIYSKVASTAAIVGALIAKFASTSEDKNEKKIADA